MTLAAVNAGAVMNAHPHLMHEPEHISIAAIGAVRNAVEAQGAGR